MTTTDLTSHDELLAKVELILGTYISKYYGSKKDVELRSDVIDSLQALRAVVELHKPSEYEPGQCWACSAYADNQYEADYPCWTIQAIEKELG